MSVSDTHMDQARPSPSAGTPKTVFFVVGEASGDELAASLAAELKSRFDDQINFQGLGAEALQKQGLTPLFDMEDIAVMGFSAVLARLPLILRRIRQTVNAIISAKPDLVILVDSPDFAHRVAKKVRALNPDIPILGWVSPSVWAWRPGRAAAMRSFIDHLMVLLPFEVDAHRRLGGPPTTYVGHPLASAWARRDQNTSQNSNQNGPDNGQTTPDSTQNTQQDHSHLASPTHDKPQPTILLLPGSRSGEIARHMTTLEKTVERCEDILQTAHQNGATYVLPAVTKHAEKVRAQIATWNTKVEMITGGASKRQAMINADAAIAASGTVTLELALAGVPMVVIYKLDPIARLVRPFLQVWTIILPNMIVGRPVVREYVDDMARPEALARALAGLATDTPERRAQVEAFDELHEAMRTPDGRTSAALAADCVEKLLSA